LPPLAQRDELLAGDDWRGRRGGAGYTGTPQPSAARPFSAARVRSRSGGLPPRLHSRDAPRPAAAMRQYKDETRSRIELDAEAPPSSPARALHEHWSRRSATVQSRADLRNARQPDAAASTNHRQGERPKRAAPWLLHWAGGQLKQQCRRRRWVGERLSENCHTWPTLCDRPTKIWGS
jgi:hypothetical protein